MKGHYSSWGKLINVSGFRSMPLSCMVIGDGVVEQGGLWGQSYYCNCTMNTHGEYPSVADPLEYCLG